MHTHRPEPRARRTLTIAAAAFVAIGLGAVALVATREQSGGGSAPSRATAPSLAPSTIETTSTATSPTTSTTTTTTSPLTDEDRASAILPTQDAFGPGWGTGPPFTLAMDADVAGASPNCLPLMAAFESASRPAAVSGALYSHEENDAMSSAYAVVFDTEQAAVDMFEATNDPAFMRACHDEYDVQLNASGSTTWFPYVGSLGGDFVSHDVIDLPALDVGADDEWQAALDYPATGEYFRLSTVRIGRSIVVIMGVIESVGGSTRLAETQFDQIVADVVLTARRTLGDI